MTYYGSVYPTVYVTVTESYDVTLSAPNATMTHTETLITPPSDPACGSTVVPIDPNEPMFTIQATINVPVSHDGSPAANGTRAIGGAPIEGSMSGKASNLPAPPKASLGNPGPRPANPGPQPEGTPEEPSFADFSPTVVPSTIYNSAPYTSTVVITKKTPVPVAPRTETPPPSFGPGPQPQPQPQPPSPPANNPPNPPNQQTGGRPGGNGQQPGGPNGGGEINTLAQLPNSGPQAGASGLIDSVIRSLIVPAAATAPAAPAAPQTTLNNVPVALRPSSVVIGSSVIPIPTGREEAVVSQGGAVFTVRSGEIVAPSATVAFGPLNPQGIISVPPTRVTAAPGIIVEVAGSTAIVDGTTFRLDEDFSTVVTVNGERISIGPSGIGLPSTTIAAARTTAAPQVVETVGHVTFTLSGSSVIIAGTTYGIASDSPTITTQVNGDRVSIGPGGIGFDSTTVKPTMDQTSTREAAAEATGSASGSGSNDGDSNGDDSMASAHLMSPFAIIVSLFALVMAL